MVKPLGRREGEGKDASAEVDLGFASELRKVLEEVENLQRIPLSPRLPF